MRNIMNRVNPWRLGCHSFRLGGAAWIAFVLLAIVSTATEARADLYNLTGNVVGVDADSSAGYTVYSSPPAGFAYSSVIGGGRGLLQVHQTLAYESFDLSGIKGQISQVTLSGTLSGLFWPYGVQNWANMGVYASMNAGVYLLGTNPALGTDPATLFQILTGQPPYQHGNVNLGGFSVDNGLTPPPFTFPPTPIGDAFSINIDPNLLLGAAASGNGLGTISLGFSGSGAAYDEGDRGVEGFLTAGLHIRTVPEPASISLCLVGATGLWGLNRNRKRRRRGEVTT